MKKLILGAFALALFASCETEPTDVTVVDETANLELMAPSAALDTSQNGMYAGVIVADESNFHGKLWVNLNNIGFYSAMIETIQGDIHHLRMTDNTNGIYKYEGAIGSFDFNPANINDTEITNVEINNTVGEARVLKETSQHRMATVLGSYDGYYTGTWNVIGPAAEGYFFVTESIITGTFGSMYVEDGTTFDPGSTGCTTFGGPQPPIIADQPNSATGDYAILAVNQTLDIPAPDVQVVYDIELSQNSADLNPDGDGIVIYDRFIGYPEATRGHVFDVPDLAAGCYNIAAGSQGFYAVVNDAGDTVLGTGQIYFDVSMLIPPPPAPTLVSNQLPTLEYNPE